MNIIRCDGCGKELKKRGLRYHVKIEVQAAYDTLEISLLDLVRSHRSEIEDLIRQLGDKSAQELEESVYKAIEVDLCPQCQRRFIRNPLHFHPETAAEPEKFDVDAFLRSLGLGKDASD
jgi:hypothetical protein